MKRVAFVTVIAGLGIAVGAFGTACDKAPPPDHSAGSSTGSAIAPASAPPAAPAGSAASVGSGSAGSGSATSAGSGSAAPTATAGGKLAHPLLWSIEKDGITTYAIGTMHLGVDADSQLPPIVWDKLQGARVFAMETDLNDPALGSLLKPTPQSLHQELGDAYWKKLEDVLGSGMANMVDHMPPMVPATALAMRGLPPTGAMDLVLSNRATTEHKPIIFLEPAVHQIEVLAKWMDVKALKMQLDELPESDQRTKDMLAAYVAGDERKLLAINDGERADALHHGYTAAEYDREMNDVLYNRNAAWIAPIEQLHAQGGGFIAVGALHLIGPRSVLDLLAKKGYKVTRLAL